MSPRLLCPYICQPETPLSTCLRVWVEESNHRADLSSICCYETISCQEKAKAARQVTKDRQYIQLEVFQCWATLLWLFSGVAVKLVYFRNK